MSRLAQLSQTQKNISETLQKSFSTDQKEKFERQSIALKFICQRYKNNYSYNKNEELTLAKRIKEEGQLQPILVVDIEKFLTNNDLVDSAREYYKSMQKLGCKYFVTSGHRRFRACISNAIGKPVLRDEDVIDFYRSLETNNLYKDLTNKDLYIDCYVVDITTKEEEKITNDSNLLTRKLSSLQIIKNIYDIMGSEDVSWKDIQDFSLENYGFSETEKNIQYNLTILKKIKDERFYEAYNNDEIKSYQLKKLCKVYDKIDKEKVLKEIREGTFDVDALLKSFEKKSRKKEKVSARVSRAEVLDLAMQIKDGKISIDKLIEFLKK